MGGHGCCVNCSRTHQHSGHAHRQTKQGLGGSIALLATTQEPTSISHETFRGTQVRRGSQAAKKPATAAQLTCAMPNLESRKRKKCPGQYRPVCLYRNSSVPGCVQPSSPLSKETETVFRGVNLTLEVPRTDVHRASHKLYNPHAGTSILRTPGVKTHIAFLKPLKALSKPEGAARIFLKAPCWPRGSPVEDELGDPRKAPGSKCFVKKCSLDHVGDFENLKLQSENCT